MKFTLEVPVGCLSKKKSRKRNDDEPKVVKEGVDIIGEAHASLKGVIKEVPEPSTIDLEAGIQAKGVDTTMLISVDVGVVEVVPIMEVEMAPPI